MVRVAIAIGSTSVRSSHQRSTARTIFITSTGSAVAVALAHGHGSCGAAVPGSRRPGMSSDDRRWSCRSSALSSRAIRCRGREEGTTTQATATGKPVRSCCACRVTRPRGHDSPHTVCAVAGRSSDSRTCRLGDLGSRSGRRRGSYWPSLPTRVVRAVLDDGGRFRLPLRGSPGFSPGSLLPRRPIARPPDQQETPYAGGGANPWHHMLGPRVASLGLPPCAAPPLASSRAQRSGWCSPRCSRAAPPRPVAAVARRPATAAYPRFTPACARVTSDREAAGGDGRPAQPDRRGARPPPVAGRRHRGQRAASRRPDRVGVRRHRARRRHHPAHRRQLDARHERPVHVAGRGGRSGAGDPRPRRRRRALADVGGVGVAARGRRPRRRSRPASVGARRAASTSPISGAARPSSTSRPGGAPTAAAAARHHPRQHRRRPGQLGLGHDGERVAGSTSTAPACPARTRSDGPCMPPAHRSPTRATASTWQFWDGDGLGGASRTRAAVDPAGPRRGVPDPVGGRASTGSYVIVSKRDGDLGNTVYAWSSDVARRSVDRPARDAGRTSRTRPGSSSTRRWPIPASTLADGRLLISISRNTTDFSRLLTDPTLGRPVFAEIDRP